MKRALRCSAAVFAIATLAAISGCGRRQEQAATELEFERRDDTTGLSRGKPLIERIEPYRTANGTLRVKGDVELPDGLRLQISLYPRGSKQLLSRVQVVVDRHHFESPPILGASGPLPAGPYRFEYLALFNDAWQTPEVMRRIGEGRGLRGPGVTRDAVGGAAFYLVEERVL